MLAYKKEHLDAWINRKMTEDAAAMGLITPSESWAILQRFPSPLFSPRTIVRIGLGFATLMAVSMFFSLVQMILGFRQGEYVVSLSLGLGALAVLEYLIRKKLHYRSGIDDMLLYQAYGMIFGSLVSFFDNIPDPSLILAASGTVLALVASARYADRLMAGLALIGLHVFIYFLLKKINLEWWIFMPLISLIISLGAWFASSKYIKDPRLLYYRPCLEFIQLLGLVIAGLCSNYYVVAEGWFGFHKHTPEGFWKGFYITTTILLPLITVVSGFLQKDKKRIRIGALMVAGAVMTCHHYLTSTPPETLCVIYGTLLLVISYWLLKYHQPGKNGISFSEKQDGKELFEIESLLIGAGVGMITRQQGPGRFGGGSFGGAGSGGEF